MKRKPKPESVALAAGTFGALVHALWAVLVAVGVAQPLMDWLYSLHFLDNPHVVAEFELGKAVTLLVVTFVFWYASGWLAALVWNWAGEART